MRRLRIAASCQLLLALPDREASTSFWDLPEATRLRVLELLGQMIARGVVSDVDGEE